MPRLFSDSKHNETASVVIEKELKEKELDLQAKNDFSLHQFVTHYMKTLIVPKELVIQLLVENDKLLNQLDLIENDQRVAYEELKTKLINNPTNIINILNFMLEFDYILLDEKRSDSCFLNIHSEDYLKSLNFGEGQCNTCIDLLNELYELHISKLTLKEKNEKQVKIGKEYSDMKRMIPCKKDSFIQVNSELQNTINQIYSQAKILMHIFYTIQYTIRNKEYKYKEINSIVELLYNKSLIVNNDLSACLIYLHKLCGYKLSKQETLTLPGSCVLPMSSKQFESRVSTPLFEHMQHTFYDNSDCFECLFKTTADGEKINYATLIDEHLQDHKKEIDNMSKMILQLKNLRLNFLIGINAMKIYLSKTD